MQRFQRGIDILLFQRKTYLCVRVVVPHAENLRSGANLIIHVKDIIYAVIFYINRIIVLVGLQRRKDIRQGFDFRQRRDIQTIFIDQFLIPYGIIGNGTVLIGRNPINPSFYLHAFPVFFRHQLIQARHIGVDHIGNVIISPQIDIRNVIVAVSPDNVKWFIGTDNNIPAFVPVAPGNDFHLQPDIDLLSDILINLRYPRIVIARHAVSDDHPFQINRFPAVRLCRILSPVSAVRRSRIAAAASQRSEHHECRSARGK